MYIKVRPKVYRLLEDIAKGGRMVMAHDKEKKEVYFKRPRKSSWLIMVHQESDGSITVEIGYLTKKKAKGGREVRIFAEWNSKMPSCVIFANAVYCFDGLIEKWLTDGKRKIRLSDLLTPIRDMALKASKRFWGGR